MVQTTIGQQLRQQRKDADYTQKEIAQRLHCHHSLVSRIENGHQLPNVAYIEKFVQVLHLSEAECRQIWARYKQASESVVEISHSPSSLLTQFREDWGEAPDVTFFYGREKELAKLEQSVIRAHCRLIGIFAFGGMGKTMLATKLAQQVKYHFDYLIWRSLLNAPPLEEMLATLIQFLSDPTEYNPNESVDRQIAQLMSRLRTHRCLLIFDNAEAILAGGKRAGDYREGYEGYGRLFQRIGETRHDSCLLLTSREKPKEVAFLEDEEGPVRSYQLDGIKWLDGQKILKGKRLKGNNEEWKTLIKRYSGNPLMLKLISETIRELFGGQIAEFLREEVTIVGDSGRLLGQHIKRLSELEQDIMYWLAIEREAITLDELQKNLAHSIPRRKMWQALKSLRRRSLVEKNEVGFTLQNVVTEYMTHRLIDQIYKEITNGPIGTKSGFNKYALMKAQAKEYVRQMQVRLILKPVAEKLLMDLRSAPVIEKQLTQILSTWREQQAALEPGYVAGNIINLLRELNCDLKGHDFSQLAIWQAYLVGIECMNVDFTSADLLHCVFAEAFGSILSVAFSPNGQLLATGSANGDVQIGQAFYDKPLFVCKGHTDWVNSVAFSPDGTILASGSGDTTVRLWDMSTGKPLGTLLGHILRVRSIAFSPDGKLLASGGDDKFVRLWDIETKRLKKVLQGHFDQVRSVAFSPDGTLLASASNDTTVRLWSLNDEESEYAVLRHTHKVKAVTFSPNGLMIATGSKNGSMQLWDVRTQQSIKALQGHTQDTRTVVFAPDGRRIASGSSDQTVRLWEVQTGECLHILRGHSGKIRSITFSPDSNFLLSNSEDHTTRWWEISSGKCIKKIQGYFSFVRSIAFDHYNSGILASGYADSTVGLWDINTGQCVNVLKGHINRVLSVTFSLNNIIATGSEDNTVRLWDMHTKKCIQMLKLPNRVRSVAFNAKGSWLAVASGDYIVRIWEIISYKLIISLKAHTGEIESIVFSPNGKFLASGSEDCTVRLWNAKTGECLKTFKGHTKKIWSIAISPDGLTLASGSADLTIRLWDVRTGCCIGILAEHLNPVRSIAFSPKQNILASGSEDTTVRLWDLNSGKCTAILQRHTNWIRSIAFSFDGTLLASGGYDGTIKIWNMPTGQYLKTLRPDRPYERMNITGVTGLTEIQKMALKALGAVEEVSEQTSKKQR